MYIQPKSFLSRLLGVAWTVLLISLLLRLAAHLLADVWIWVIAIVAVVILVRIGFWWRSFRREYW